MKPSLIGSRVRNMREQVGMSGRELSRIAGLSSPNTVAQMERDPRCPMLVSTAVAIANVFGCSLDWMILGVGKAPPPRSIRARVEQRRALDRARRPNEQPRKAA